MPALSPTMTAGNIAEWKVSPGSKVNAGDVIADIETDKATMALESMEEGYIAKILVPTGAQDVQVGEVVAIMVEEEGDCGRVDDYVPPPLPRCGSRPAGAPAADPPAAAPSAAAPPAAAPPRLPAPRASGARVFATLRRAQRRRRRASLSEQVTGTGPGGRVVLSDVELAIENGVQPIAASAAPGAGGDADGFARFFPPFEDVSVSQIKKVTAARLTSQSARCLTSTSLWTCAWTSSWRCAVLLTPGWRRAAKKISVNDFVVKASARRSARVPR